MEHIDLRKLNNDELYMIRKQVVRLKKQGLKGSEIEKITGIYQTRISQIWEAYKTGGDEGLRPEKSGRKPKTHMVLTIEEQREIRLTIVSKTPNQLKLAGFLWTLAKISQHIWDVYRKRVSVRCLSNYMKRWGLTCQRPTKRAPRKVFLILDNLRVHHGKIVAAWLLENKDKIEVFFLPPYAPESNPDEYLNHSLKLDVHSGNLPKSKKDLTHKIHSFMRRLQHCKDRVLAFFRHPALVYCYVQE